MVGRRGGALLGSRPGDRLKTSRDKKDVRGNKRGRTYTKMDEEICSDEETNDQVQSFEWQEKRSKLAATDDPSRFGSSQTDSPQQQSVEAIRVALAKDYLKNVDWGDDEGTRSLINTYIEREQGLGLSELPAAESDWDLEFEKPTFHKGHKLSPTCVAVGSTKAYTGGKDCSIIEWDAETGKRTLFPGARKNFTSGGHFEIVTDVQLCETQSVLASVGLDQAIRIWDTRLCGQTCVAAIRAHKDAINCLGFQNLDSTEMICTGSKDKSIKIWNMKTRRLMDTLFGHTAEVLAMDASQSGVLVTGGADRTIRSWRVLESSHLVYGPSANSQTVDCIAAGSSSLYLAGYPDGTLTLWNGASRKPAVSMESPHGGKAITSVAFVRPSNCFLSGSYDGHLQVWRASIFPQSQNKSNGSSKKQDREVKMQKSSSVSVDGLINGIGMSTSCRFIALAVGKEHKQGRWLTTPALNGISIVPIRD